MSVLGKISSAIRKGVSAYRPVGVAMIVFGAMAAITVATEGTAIPGSGDVRLHGFAKTSSSSIVSGDRLSISAPEQTSGGYRFRAIEVKEASDGDWSVWFIPSWAGDSFPGKRSCEWILYDSDGNQVGAASQQLTTMAADYSDPISFDIGRVTERPSTASIVCGDQRLDDPSGSFSISNVQVQESSRLGTYVDVVFDYEWVGAADPTPQMCDISIIGPDGSVLASRSGGFSGGDGNGHGTFAVDLPPESLDEELTATVTCTSIR